MENTFTSWLGGEFYFNFHSRESRWKPMTKCLKHLENAPNLNFLEIGSCEGQSTLWFIKKILTHESSKITCIDPHFENDWYNKSDNEYREKTDKTTFEIFKKNILEKYSEKITYFRKKSWEVLPFLKDKFDVIYVDGCHDFANVYVDTRLSSDLLKKDGIVMFDDYWPKQSCDVYNAVSQLRREGYYNNKAELNSNNVLILGPQ